MVGFLTREQMLAVIDVPTMTWLGQRDHLLLTLMFNTGIQPEIVDMLLAITLLLVSLPIIAKLIFGRYAAKSSALASSWGS